MIISNLHEQETSLALFGAPYTNIKYLSHQCRKQENKHLHPLRPPKGGLTRAKTHL